MSRILYISSVNYDRKHLENSKTELENFWIFFQKSGNPLITRWLLVQCRDKGQSTTGTLDSSIVADFRFIDTSQSFRIKDLGLVCHVMCLSLLAFIANAEFSQWSERTRLKHSVFKSEFYSASTSRGTASDKKRFIYQEQNKFSSSLGSIRKI